MVRDGELGTDPLTAAGLLLGAELSAGGVTIRIVEVEAYGGPGEGPWPDPASHAHRGPRPRNAVMFGPPGRLYTYRSHGIHVCANISCGPGSEAGAVLLRAGVVICGAEAARARRGPSTAPEHLARGPGNLCAAMGITMEHNGLDVSAPDSAVRLRMPRLPADASRGPRVGVSLAADRPWRLWLAGSPEVSAYRRSQRAPAPGLSD